MDYHKNITESSSIEVFPAPDEIVLPLSQHIGAPCKALVAKGDTVKVGQKIAEADAFISAPIHSSVSGVVTAISKRPCSGKTLVDSIIIENDKQDIVHEDIKPYKQLSELSSEEIINIIKESGLVGLGGATFPTYVKLIPPRDKTVDSIVINGAECEPFLSADHRVMLERAGDIILGAKAVAQALRVTNIYIGIEDNKLDAISTLEGAIVSEDKYRFKVIPLKTKYPQGAEKVLVKTILKRKVPPIGIPLDVGVVVINVSTAAQVAKTLNTGMPLIDRVVTVAGKGVERPGNYQVKLGTLFKHFFKKGEEKSKETVNDINSKDNISSNSISEGIKKVIMGGPMMGVAQWTLDVPVIKGTSGIISIAPLLEEEGPCIRCGRCIEACPFDLIPLNDADDSCMECGLCAYVCPAKRHLVQRIKLAKDKRKQKGSS